MGEDILVISNLNYRHKIRKPQWNNPWKNTIGHGLTNVSFNVKSGQIIGLVGPNGAGKTTLLEIIAGLHVPEEGRVTISGNDSTTVMSRGFVGFMPENVNWNGKSTPRKCLQRLSVMRGCEDTVDELLKSVGLVERADNSLDTLSLGMKQRLSLAASLMGMPELLLLDEPLNGLDPVAQEALKNLLLNLSKTGKSVIISSHFLSELERFVDHIIVLNKGSLVIEGTIKDIENELNLGGKLVIEGIKSKEIEIEKSISELDFVREIEYNVENNDNEWQLNLRHLKGKWGIGQREKIVEKLVSNNCTPNTIQLLNSNLSQILTSVTNVKKIDMKIQEEE